MLWGGSDSGSFAGAVKNYDPVVNLLRMPLYSAVAGHIKICEPAVFGSQFKYYKHQSAVYR